MTKKRPRKPPTRPHKTKRKGKASERGKREPLPDLHAILGAFSDAAAFVSVALDSIRYGGDCGPEEYVLRMGVEALDKVYKQLDDAERQVGRVARAHRISLEEVQQEISSR